MNFDATLLLLSYQQVQFVEAAVRTLFNLRDCRLRIILSDDASTDGSWDVIQRLAAGYRGDHVVETRRNSVRGGLVGHVNGLMREVETELVILAASDDGSRPERAARLLQTWRAAGKPRVYLTSDARFMDETDQPGELLCAQPPPPDTPLIERVKNMGEGVLGCTGAFHRAVWTTFGPLTVSRQVEDRPLAFRAVALDGILHLREPLVDYRVHRRNLSRSPGAAPTAPSERRRRWDFQVQVFGQFLADLDHPAFAERFGEATVAIARQEARRRFQQAQLGLEYLDAKGWHRWNVIARAGLWGRSPRRLLGWSWETLVPHRPPHSNPSA